MELPEEVKCRDGISTKSGTIVYDGDKEGVSVAVQGTEKKEGNIREIGVRSLITISNAKAPKEYTFNFSIPKDSKLVYGKDFDKEEFYSNHLGMKNYERYMPNGWKIFSGKFDHLIPKEEQYWIEETKKTEGTSLLFI